ncbi:MAG: hypothetical protein JWM91_5301 [Rhodospirillales bacterium]|nr:hypothetical protein [Rhodospirillales bacterium]
MIEDGEDRVRERAFLIWEAKGCPEGHADARWDMAQAETAVKDNSETIVLPIRPSKEKPLRVARTARR